MKAYGGYIAAQRRQSLFFSKTSIVATTFTASNDEDACQIVAKIASSFYKADEGWYNQQGSVTPFSSATLDVLAQQIAAALYDERVRLEQEANTPAQDT